MTKRKASASNALGDCVTADDDTAGLITVTDSKNPGQPGIAVTPARWRQFLRSVLTSQAVTGPAVVAVLLLLMHYHD